MYDKELALRVFRIIRKKAESIRTSKDTLEAAFTATEMLSMLDLFAEIIKLDDTKTINIISIKKEG